MLTAAYEMPEAKALSIYTDNLVGNLSIVAPPEGPPVSNSPGIWVDVPGLSTGVYSHAGDNLAITVSAEIFTASSVWLRALVDGEPVAPSDVVFKQGGENFDGVRSFTFVKNNVLGGKRLVQIQWLTASDVNAQIRDRSLTVNSAAPAWGTGRLITISSETDWITKTSATWEDIPDMSQTVITEGTSRDLKVTFSAHTRTENGRFKARALVDGEPTADVVFEDAGNLSRGGARSFSFTRNGLTAGTHAIKVQWKAENGQIHVADRTMSTFSNEPSTTGGGLLAVNWEGGEENVTSTDWVDVSHTSGSFTTNEPSTNVEVEFGSEVRTNNGRLFLRAVIDGEPLEPGDVTYVASGSTWRAQSFSFLKKNILSGTHSVKVQVAVDTGAAGVIGDRALTVNFKRRSGLDFVQPYSSLKIHHGTLPFLVICFDPQRPGETAPTQAYITNMHNGGDGGRSVVGWFNENTGGLFKPDPFTFLSCNDSGWFRPPTERSGTWYWDTGNFGLMWEDALKAADPSFDFHTYDLNKDNHITGDELVVAIVRPQNVPSGTLRTASASLDDVSTRLSVDILDVYISSNQTDDFRRWNLGLLAHEACHGMLGAVDMYSGYDTNPGLYSLMSDHSRATHFDPFHKLKSGYLTPDVIEISTWSTRDVNISAVETMREATIIYDPAKNDKEYFILENRWIGTPPFNYDQPLQSQGIAVWHIVQDFATMNALPPSGDPGFPVGNQEWSRKGVRYLGILSNAGATKELFYANGTSSKIQVTAKAGPGEFVNTEIAKLP